MSYRKTYLMLLQLIQYPAAISQFLVQFPIVALLRLCAVASHVAGATTGVTGRASQPAQV